MTRYEYKVVPAPTKGPKVRGVKTPEGRFAAGIEATLNEMGSAGWEYLRAELLPSDERSGLTGSAVHWRNVLVFRRAPAAADTVAEAVAEPEPEPERREPPRLATGAERMLKDNGVEELSEVSGMTEALRNRAARRGSHLRKGEADGSGDD